RLLQGLDPRQRNLPFRTRVRRPRLLDTYRIEHYPSHICPVLDILASGRDGRPLRVCIWPPVSSSVLLVVSPSQRNFRVKTSPKRIQTPIRPSDLNSISCKT